MKKIRVFFSERRHICEFMLIFRCIIRDVSAITSSLEGNLFPWGIFLGLKTDSSRWKLVSEDTVDGKAISSAIRIILPLLRSTCDMVHCLGEN